MRASLIAILLLLYLPLSTALAGPLGGIEAGVIDGDSLYLLTRGSEGRTYLISFSLNDWSTTWSVELELPVKGLSYRMWGSNGELLIAAQDPESAFLVDFSTNGSVRWAYRLIPSSWPLEIRDAVPTGDGFVIGGSVPVEGIRRPFIAKVNGKGMVWAKWLDLAGSLADVSEGSVLVSGASWGGRIWYIIEFRGDEVVRAYELEPPLHVTSLSDGGVILAGSLDLPEVENWGPSPVSGFWLPSGEVVGVLCAPLAPQHAYDDLFSYWGEDGWALLSTSPTWAVRVRTSPVERVVAALRHGRDAVVVTDRRVWILDSGAVKGVLTPSPLRAPLNYSKEFLNAVRYRLDVEMRTREVRVDLENLTLSVERVNAVVRRADAHLLREWELSGGSEVRLSEEDAVKLGAFLIVLAVALLIIGLMNYGMGRLKRSGVRNG
ncbi:MAG: hypothetical protein QI199_03830 [Candidatus Korarchaeota archaeon]|nr:hypothetical protein [Candidatus Korarchaeota archaeon]